MTAISSWTKCEGVSPARTSKNTEIPSFFQIKNLLILLRSCQQKRLRAYLNADLSGVQ